MERRTFIGGALAAATLTSSIGLAADKPAGDLAKVRSRYLDELLKAPSADFAAYKKFRLAEVRGETDPAWLKSMNFDRKGAPRMSEADSKSLAEASAAALARSLVQAFSAGGMEMVKEPGPGVLNVKASATNVFLNAPESRESGSQSIAEEIGKVNLALEASDAASGKVLLKTAHRGTAKTVDGASRATSVSNRFYFDNLFNDWSKNVVAEMKK